MTRPGAGKPRYRLRVMDIDGYLLWWMQKVRTRRGDRMTHHGASSWTSAEAIRRAPR